MTARIAPAIDDAQTARKRWSFKAGASGYADSKSVRLPGQRSHNRLRVAHIAGREFELIRDVEGFDALAAVLFDHQYRVSRAALIPGVVVRERLKFVGHTNSHKFMLTDDVWEDRRVRDVTGDLRAVESSV